MVEGEWVKRMDHMHIWVSIQDPQNGGRNSSHQIWRAADALALKACQGFGQDGLVAADINN